MGKSMLNGICYGSDSATDINYDNTSSGMSATNTQDAIDELKESLSECFQSVSNGKALVASAITDKGTPMDATATFEEMANAIRLFVLSPNSLSGSVSLGYLEWGQVKEFSVAFSPTFAKTPKITLSVSNVEHPADQLYVKSSNGAGFVGVIELGGTSGSSYDYPVVHWYAVV